MLPISALYFFGGETLKDFAFALLVGIGAGAYSSIFIAAPLVAMLKEREPEYARRRDDSRHRRLRVGRGPAATRPRSSRPARPTPDLIPDVLQGDGAGDGGADGDGASRAREDGRPGRCEAGTPPAAAQSRVLMAERDSNTPSRCGSSSRSWRRSSGPGWGRSASLHRRRVTGSPASRARHAGGVPGPGAPPRAARAPAEVLEKPQP